jgi:excisionase family DNA binding protein
VTDPTAQPDSPSGYLTAAEAAEILGVSERSVRRRLAAGRLPGLQVDGRWMVEAAAVTGPDTVTGRPDRSANGDRTSGQSGPVDVQALVDALADMAGRYAEALERNAALEARALLAEGRLRELEAGLSATPVTRPDEVAEVSEKASGAPRRVWWAPWRRATA